MKLKLICSEVVVSVARLNLGRNVLREKSKNYITLLELNVDVLAPKQSV